MNLFLLGEKEKQAEVVFENEYEEVTPSEEPKPVDPTPDEPEPPKPPTEEPTDDKFEQTSTTTIGLGLFVVLSVLGLVFIISKKKKQI